MKHTSIYQLFRAAVMGAFLFLGTHFSHAVNYHFSIDTSGLPNDTASGAPFSLALSFIGDGPNSVTITNFDFGGGSAIGIPTTAGDAVGDLSSSVTMTTLPFFNDFFQEFTPGSSLSFDVYFASPFFVNLNPDTFSFYILDNTLGALPTGHDAYALGTVELTTIPVAQAYSSTSFGVTATVPDQGTTFGLFGLALLGLAGVNHSVRRRNKAAV